LDEDEEGVETEYLVFNEHVDIIYGNIFLRPLLVVPVYD